MRNPASKQCLYKQEVTRSIPVGSISEVPAESDFLAQVGTVRSSAGGRESTFLCPLVPNDGGLACEPRILSVFVGDDPFHLGWQACEPAGLGVVRSVLRKLPPFPSHLRPRQLLRVETRHLPPQSVRISTMAMVLQAGRQKSLQLGEYISITHRADPLTT